MSGSDTGSTSAPGPLGRVRYRNQVLTHRCRHCGEQLMEVRPNDWMHLPTEDRPTLDLWCADRAHLAEPDPEEPTYHSRPMIPAGVNLDSLILSRVDLTENHLPDGTPFLGVVIALGMVVATAIIIGLLIWLI